MSYLENPITNLHAALAHALYEGLPVIEYEDRDWEHWHKTNRKEDRKIKKTRKHTERDVAVIAMFPQTWSSTALGFGGLGGQAITDAYTIVINSQYGLGYCVYFGGRFAYRIERINDEFMNDMAKRSMAAVSEAKAKYEQSI
jgi:hypothetical protein